MIESINKKEDNMEVTQTRFAGIVIAAVRDANGNYYNLRTGEISAATGQKVTLTGEEKNLMDKTVGDLVARKHTVLRYIFPNAFKSVSAPENILELVVQAKENGSQWMHHVSTPMQQFTNSIFEAANLRIDSRTGGVCIPAAYQFPLEPSLIEWARAVIDNPTRFICSSVATGGDAYRVDTVQNPEAAPYLQLPRKLVPAPDRTL
jgi:hypothetical protein